MFDLKLAHVLFFDSSEVQSDFLLSDQGDFDQLSRLIRFLYNGDYLLSFCQSRINFFAGVGFRQIDLHLLESLYAQMTPKLFLRLDLSDQDLSDPQSLLIDLINICQRYLNLACVSGFHKGADHEISWSLIRLKGLNGSLLILLGERDIHIVDVTLLISEEVGDEVFPPDSPVADGRHDQSADVHLGFRHALEVLEAEFVNGEEIIHILLQGSIAEAGLGRLGIALDLLAGLLVGQWEGLLVDPLDRGGLGVALQLLEGGGEQAGLVEEEVAAGGRVAEWVVIVMRGLLLGAGLARTLHC